MNPILKLGLIIYLCSFSSLATVESASVEETFFKKGGFFNGQADTNQVRIYGDPTIHFNLENGMLVSGDRYSEMWRDGDRPVSLAALWNSPCIMCWLSPDQESRHEKIGTCLFMPISISNQTYKSINELLENPQHLSFDSMVLHQKDENQSNSSERHDTIVGASSRIEGNQDSRSLVELLSANRLKLLDADVFIDEHDPSMFPSVSELSIYALIVGSFMTAALIILIRGSIAT